jgi:hypothetical protein
MTIKALYPTVRPTLNLDFAKTKALDPRVTFTRASTATFVGSNGLIQTAASGAARFDHNPATGESLGLLVEEARTNLLTYSEQFDNAIWTKGNTSITANAATAPDGTTTADTVVATSGLGYKEVYQTFTSSVSPSTAYTFSIFVKANGARYFTVVPYFNTVSYPSWFDLSTGQALSNTSGNTSTITAYPNGWYKCSVTRTSAATGNAIFIVRPADADLEQRYTGAGAACLYLWGAQLEAGSFPTSYIPTTTATVTRAADVASMTGSNFSSWYRQDEGTFVANVLSTPSVQSLAFDCGNNAINSAGLNGHIFQLFATSVNATTEVSGVTQASPTVSFTGSTARSAYGCKLNNFNLATNGTLGTLDTSGTVPTLASQQLVIGTRFNGTFALNKPIARLAYYPVRLPDAQLQALTAT